MRLAATNRYLSRNSHDELCQPHDKPHTTESDSTSPGQCVALLDVNRRLALSWHAPEWIPGTPKSSMEVTATVVLDSELECEKVLDETSLHIQCICSAKMTRLSLIKRHQTGAGLPVRQETCMLVITVTFSTIKKCFALKM